MSPPSMSEVFFAVNCAAAKIALAAPDITRAELKRMQGNAMKYWNGPRPGQITPIDTIASARLNRLEVRSLAGVLVIELRHHGHFNNVLTHLFAADWAQVETSLARLLDSDDESPLTSREADLVSLLCGERGVTGKLMRPWIAAQLRRFVSDKSAERLERTWCSWHQLRMILPPRFRTSATHALRKA